METTIDYEPAPHRPPPTLRRPSPRPETVDYRESPSRRGPRPEFETAHHFEPPRGPQVEYVDIYEPPTHRPPYRPHLTPSPEAVDYRAPPSRPSPRPLRTHSVRRPQAETVLYPETAPHPPLRHPTPRRPETAPFPETAHRPPPRPVIPSSPVIPLYPEPPPGLETRRPEATWYERPSDYPGYTILPPPLRPQRSPTPPVIVPRPVSPIYAVPPPNLRPQCSPTPPFIVPPVPRRRNASIYQQSAYTPYTVADPYAISPARRRLPTTQEGQGGYVVPDDTTESEPSLCCGLLYTLLNQLYLHFLLRLPSLYRGRVARILEGAELTVLDFRLMAQQPQSNPTPWRVRSWGLDDHRSGVSHVLVDFGKDWVGFIDSLLEEWRTLNVVSTLLTS